MNQSIRLALPSDSEAILEIYQPYVLDAAVCAETEVPEIGAFTARIAAIAGRYPFLVYEADGEIVGYTYASRHRERAGYLYDAEVSIYLRPAYHGTGIAYKLYGCLLDILAKLGYRNVYAGYAGSNEKSMNFHRKIGFSIVGTYHKAVHKFGQWFDVIWLEKAINEYSAEPGAIKAIGELPAQFLDDLFRAYAENPTERK